MTPNSSETPTSSQELADVLRKIAAKDKRIAELEAAIRLIVGTHDRFEASSIEDADVSTMLALTGTVRAIGRAEAILGTGSQAAPKEGEDDLMTCPNCEEGMDKVCSDGWRCPECGEECRVIPCRRQDDGAGQR